MISLYSFKPLAPPSCTCTATNSSCYSYVGCFMNKASNGLTSLYSGSATTVDYCSDLAAASYYQYFVLQNGNACYGSNSSAGAVSPGLSTACTANCAGGGGPCGGANANALFRVGFTMWSQQRILERDCLG